MPSFSEKSAAILATCHPDIQRVMNEVVKHFDCTPTEGTRTLERQKKLLAEGKTKTLNSKHLHTPSQAIDIVPYPIDYLDRERFHLFAGFVLGIASQLGVKLRWGGDWDMDTEVDDNTFDDLPHYELVSA